jgi:predicted ATPase with chaperone activity
VKNALRNNSFNYPNGQVNIALTPRNLGKGGTGFDLPIALSILQAKGEIMVTNTAHIEFAGELGLFGELGAIYGALTHALSYRGISVPDELPHHKHATLDLLRKPIENSCAIIARTKYRDSFPCEFQLLAAMSP